MLVLDRPAIPDMYSTREAKLVLRILTTKSQCEISLYLPRIGVRVFGLHIFLPIP